MFGPLLFANRGAIVKKFVFQKKNFNSKKKISKKAFFAKKKLFTEHEFEKCCEAKKMHKGHITGRRKFQQEKIKIEGVAFISKKYLKSHFRDPKFFSFFQFRILRSVSVCSLYLLQTLV